MADSSTTHDRAREGLVEFVHDSDDTVTIRGMGAFRVLKQFQWALLRDNGITIPREKRDLAEAALRSAGLQIIGGSVRPTRRGDRGAPPECANPDCGQPYRHGTIPQPGQRCHACREVLSLRQAYTRRCPGGPHCECRDNPCEPGQGQPVVVYRGYDAVAIG